MSKWKMVKIKDVAEIVSGSTPKTSIKEFWNGELDWVTPAELKEYMVVIDESERKITQLAVEKTGLKKFPKGTILLSSRAPIGKVAIAGKDMYCNQGFKNLICNEELYNKFLFWYLRGKTQYLNSLGRGATFKEISKKIVENIEIPLPQLKIQKHIAETLDKVTEIINLHKQRLEELDNLIKATFHDMFGDPIVNEKGWKTKLLGEMCNIVSGGTPSRSTPGYFKGNIPWITTVSLGKTFIDKKDAGEYITEEAITNSATKLIKANSLMFGTRVGVGKISINKVGMCTNQDIVSLIDIDENKIDKVYLVYLINGFAEYFEHHKRGATIKGIKSDILKNIKIILPTITEQTIFSNIVTKIEEQKTLEKQAISESENLFNSLMSKYFD